MITVRLSGGLGNQLFQYAAARRLALKRNTRVRLDTAVYGSWLSKPREAHRPFELMSFALDDPIVPRGAGLAAMEARRLALAALRHAGLYTSPRIYRHMNLEFDSRILDLPDGITLDGYFQSEKYFADAKGDIREEFVPRDAQLKNNIAERVRALRRAPRELVSLHIRRGDYLRFKQGAMVEPAEKARETMALFPDCDFLVFSDDLPWCREHLNGPDVVYSPFETGLENLVAMTACDHNIVAGSTFGWWGAWLNPNPAKKVVARANWFTAWPNQSNINRDIHAEGWTKI
ncbi:MAG: alpha-1,2-fucosyltransferase [Proteobacteria bacterium]|nr:alpha-1,2-fucosyltransferase [Pseudomonadota bacterium]